MVTSYFVLRINVKICDNQIYNKTVVKVLVAEPANGKMMSNISDRRQIFDSAVLFFV